MIDENQFDELLALAPRQEVELFKRQLEATLNYSPVIAFLGKTGVGKSSTANAMFNRSDLFRVGDVEATTRAPQAASMPFRRGELTLLDVPGIGEDLSRKAEYESLYVELFRDGFRAHASEPHHAIDAFVWILRADDRAFEVDTAFLRGRVWPAASKAMKRRVVIALNQADKIEPVRGVGGWDDSHGEPGYRQLANLESKRVSVAEQFNIPIQQVVVYSANERWNISSLFDVILDALPPKRRPLTVKIAEEADAAREAARSRPFDAEGSSTGDPADGARNGRTGAKPCQSGDGARKEERAGDPRTRGSCGPSTNRKQAGDERNQRARPTVSEESRKKANSSFWETVVVVAKEVWKVVGPSVLDWLRRKLTK